MGYFNQSIIGYQNISGTDTYFDGGKRFSGFNVGLSIPITFFSNAGRIKSVELQRQSLEKNADNTKIQLKSQLENAFEQYNQNLSQFNYYKNQALPNADLITRISKLSFNSGEIGYMEYLMALQTATDVQLSYLQSVNQLNQAIININFLINR